MPTLSQKKLVDLATVFIQSEMASFLYIDIVGQFAKQKTRKTSFWGLQVLFTRML